MDPEPGRCRRTDGKKWRCSREVIPDQKYCERHMHRGCQRSRKHVEGSLVTPASGGTLNSSNAMTKTNSISTYTNCNLCSSIPSNLQLATPSLNTLSNTPATTPPAATTNCIGGINGGDNNVVAKNDNIATTYSSNTTTTTTITTTITGPASAAAENNSRSRSNCDQIADKINIRGSSNNVNDCKVGSFVPGFGIPTRTVLQGGTLKTLIYF